MTLRHAVTTLALVCAAACGGDGTIDVTLRVQPNGLVTAVTAGAGNPIAAVSNPRVRVAPGGRFTLDVQYDFVAGGGCSFGQRCRLRVAGTSPANAVHETTPGGYSYALAPTFIAISTGDVEVTRLGALPYPTRRTS